MFHTCHLLWKHPFSIAIKPNAQVQCYFNHISLVTAPNRAGWCNAISMLFIFIKSANGYPYKVIIVLMDETVTFTRFKFALSF